VTLITVDELPHQVRWPRLFEDHQQAFNTPSVARAYELINFCPVADAVGGLLECMQEWGQMSIASSWALVARSCLDTSTDPTVRFEARYPILHLMASQCL
jgi:hypothetical protein